MRRDTSKKPIIIIGQDESIFKQYCLSKKQWFLPDGSTNANPKDEGQGIMISAFVSRDLGFGFNISPHDLRRINNCRHGSDYLDKEAALEIFDRKEKHNLTESPFVRYFEYGKNQEGYWNYNHMIIQFEDVVDCLKVIFGNKYNYVFYFNHSSGHDCQRPDGLNEKRISKFYGGSQPFTRDSVMVDETYLGPFNPINKLKVGETQRMHYDIYDVGPGWMDNAERLRLMFDKQLDEFEMKTKKELIAEIITRTRLRTAPTGDIKTIRDLAVLHGIELQSNRHKKVQGWMYKPKGSLQILYERGFIDPSKRGKACESYYLVDGKKSRITGELIPGTSLTELIRNLPDFQTEQTLLQYHAELMGVTVVTSPKYHPEIAGEAIEYCWGLSKNLYRQKDIKEKRNKDLYINLVRDVLSNTTVLTKLFVRKFGKRMRRYIIAYLALEKAKITDDVEVGVDMRPEMSCMLVRRWSRSLRTHIRFIGVF